MAEPRIPLEDMEDVEDFADLEVDLVVDLMVSVADEMLDPDLVVVESGLFGVVVGSGIVPLSKMETGTGRGRRTTLGLFPSRRHGWRWRAPRACRRVRPGCQGSQHFGGVHSRNPR